LTKLIQQKDLSLQLNPKNVDCPFISTLRIYKKMTREERLVFCKKCLKRQMDFQQGLLCSLTGEKAIFEGDCSSYERDLAVKEQVYVAADTHPIALINSLSIEKLALFKEEQNLNLAIGTGIMAGILGAVIWGLITVTTGYQIGYMAIAIGAGVGFTMRYFGKGVDQIYGILGAIIAVTSCFIGNFFSIIGFAANSENLNYFNTFLQFDYAYFFPLMSETFSLMDVLFYAFAGYQGYKFSFRNINEEELNT
jgi:hypothetical protein